MPYAAAVAEIRFLLNHVAGYAAVAATDRFAEATPDLIDAMLTEMARLSDEVLAPLNRVGDLNPARLDHGVVRTPPGFAEGLRACAEAGLNGLTADPAYGGLGLPQSLSAAVHDMLSGACMALELAPLLTMGHIEALQHHASDEIKAVYLPPLIAGDWTGTMNLTEPQAGSDVGALTTRADPAGDGTFRITGRKIFITWGDNDFAANVCHLVLARLPDAPPGTKGISLFLVPKYLPDAHGAPGTRNALRVARLEHKMGVHGSPTAEMAFEGATGWIVGPPGGGMAAMFTMMNNARLGVAMQGIGVAEAAFQAARAYANQRVQGGGPIVRHADVRRMLGTMRADILAARAIALTCAVAIDLGATGDARAQARAAFLTPIAKAFGTDVGHDVAHLAIQVHGGAGFIEDTGVAQFARDVRITPIYEGTNGIQALDLVGRKLSDGGVAAGALLDQVAADCPGLTPQVDGLRAATAMLVARPVADRGAVAVPYLRAWARVLGGWAHGLAAQAGDDARGRLAVFYRQHLLPEADAKLAEVMQGELGGLTVQDFVD